MTAVAALPSARFRAEREADWLRLESLLDRAERRSAAVLDGDELLALPTLYRATISALSVARATSLDRALVDYLEALSTRAYFYLYGVRGGAGRRVADFFQRDWPTAVRALRRETLATLVLLVAGTIAGLALVAADPAWFASIVPESLAGGRTPDAGTASLRGALYGGGHARDGLELLAGFLFTNNAQVALTCFALGFLLGIPTALLIFQNGLVLGAFLALYRQRGLTGELVGWLGVHGTTELFAVALAGAAGLRIGWAIIFPGRRTRLDAMASAGAVAGTVMLGVGIMLFVAALLEGFVRQLVTVDALRYAIAMAALAGWLCYFYLPLRASRPRA